MGEHKLLVKVISTYRMYVWTITSYCWCTLIVTLQGSLPARLKKVLIVLAPLWFKAPFKILRLFVKEKLRDRVGFFHL